MKIRVLVGFEVLTAVSTKVAVFCVVVPCSLVEAARTSEMSVNFYQNTRHYNPEDSHLRVFSFKIHSHLAIHLPITT
jgi:hypothetical protein